MGIGGTCPLAEQAESLRPGWLRTLEALLFREEARELREPVAPSGMELVLREGVHVAYQVYD